MEVGGIGGGGCIGGCNGGGIVVVRDRGDDKDSIGGNVEPESEDNGGSVDIEGRGTVEKFVGVDGEDIVIVGYGSAIGMGP